MQTERVLLVVIVAVLVGIGIVMIYNSSIFSAISRGGESATDFFLKRQLLWLILSAVAFAVCTKIPYETFLRGGRLALLASLGLLALVFVPGIGVARNAAHRWISLGGKLVQPAEFAKIGVLLFLVHALAERQRKIDRFAGTYVPMLLGVGAVCAMTLAQPDLGTTMVIGVVGLLLLFAGGVPLRYLAGSVAAAAPVLAVKIASSPYQMKRIWAFLDPLAYSSNYAYQQYQSLIALGTGGWFGVGLGASRQKLGFIPYVHNDFIGSIIGEELGFVGICAIILLYVSFIAIGFRIAMRAPDLRGHLLAVGITSLIAIQAIIHIGVVSCSIPATGLNLPFVSFGGSSLMMSFVGVGLLSNVARATEHRPTARLGVRCYRSRSTRGRRRHHNP